MSKVFKRKMTISKARSVTRACEIKCLPNKFTLVFSNSTHSVFWEFVVASRLQVKTVQVHYFDGKEFGEVEVLVG